MKNVITFVVIIYLLMICLVFCIGCDPMVIAPEPATIIFPQFDPNWVNNEEEPVWWDSFDPNSLFQETEL